MLMKERWALFKNKKRLLCLSLNWKLNAKNNLNNKASVDCLISVCQVKTLIIIYDGALCEHGACVV